MRTFHCDHCKNPVYFEDTRCTHCGHELGLVPEVLRVSALKRLPDGNWSALAPLTAGTRYRQCENYAEHGVCNWMLPAASSDRLCLACRLNHTIPNLSRPGFTERWHRLERSKRRLIYSLLKLGLPLHSRADDPATGLAFSFMSNLDTPAGVRVTTGHSHGHITINIDEADPALRERARIDLDEKYRTLLGHFRHEIGHYYWDRLIRERARLDEFRGLFGDERTDYAAALDQYYEVGAPPGWEREFISRYAGSHPWEDWAESWAHYLHIVDTLETAAHYRVQIEIEHADGGTTRARPRFDAYRIADFDDMLQHWVPLTRALNSLNRSMGLQDLYPFALPEPAVRKLAFVHETIRDARRFDSGYADDRDVDFLRNPGPSLRQAVGEAYYWLTGKRKRR